MSDDLVKRLRDVVNYYNSGGRWAAADRIEELEAQNKRLRDQMRLYHISVEALSEIKASVDGKSDQPVADIIYGLLDEIAKTKEEDF
jgi:hypothetical protein